MFSAHPSSCPFVFFIQKCVFPISCHFASHFFSLCTRPNKTVFYLFDPFIHEHSSPIGSVTTLIRCVGIGGNTKERSQSRRPEACCSDESRGGILKRPFEPAARARRKLNTPSFRSSAKLEQTAPAPMSTADAQRIAIADDQGSVDGMCAHELTNHARVRERTTPLWFPRTALISTVLVFRTHPPLMHNFVCVLSFSSCSQRNGPS